MAARKGSIRFAFDELKSSAKHAKRRHHTSIKKKRFDPLKESSFEHDGKIDEYKKSLKRKIY